MLFHGVIEDPIPEVLLSPDNGCLVQHTLKINTSVYWSLCSLTIHTHTTTTMMSSSSLFSGVCPFNNHPHTRRLNKITQKGRRRRQPWPMFCLFRRRLLFAVTSLHGFLYSHFLRLSLIFLFLFFSRRRWGGKENVDLLYFQPRTTTTDGATHRIRLSNSLIKLTLPHFVLFFLFKFLRRAALLFVPFIFFFFSSIGLFFPRSIGRKEQNKKGARF